MDRGFADLHIFQKSIKENEMDKTDKLEGRVFTLQRDSSGRFIKR